MDPLIARQILERHRFAWLVTDGALIVTDVGDDLGHFGADPAACLGRPLTEVAAELIGSEDVLAEILAGERASWDLALVGCPEAAGDERYVRIVDLPRRDANGAITGVVHYVEDATEIAAREQWLTQRHNELRFLQDQLACQVDALAAAVAEMRRLDEVKSAFVSVAAHELRSPLSSVLAYVELLLDGAFGPVADAQRESLLVVLGGTRRLLEITEDLLDSVRIEAGRLDLLLEPTDLGTIIAQVAAEYHPRVEAKGQTLCVRVPDGVPRALCDRTRAAQIVGNLVSNAHKYTPPGGTITLSLGPAPDEGFLEVVVADTGVGIAPDEREHLFHRFYRTDSARRTGEGGTGLGLHIARSLVDLHGGRVWFESQVGRGTVFHVTFPTTEAQLAD